MPNSPRMNWPYPAEDQDPWFEVFEDLVNAADASSAASREDRSTWMGGGGTVSFNATTGELAWDTDFDIFSSNFGFIQSVAAGSVTLAEGEVLYVDLVRRPTTNVVLPAQVATTAPYSDASYPIAIRSNDVVWFRFGSRISNGESKDIFEGGGSSATGSDSYERAATFQVPDGSSTSQLATVGRIAYAGSIVGLSLDLTEAVNSGTIDVTVRINGADTLTATLDSGNPESALSTAVVGTHVVVPGDEIEVFVDPTAYDNISGLDGGLTASITLTVGTTFGASPIPDASASQKGLTRLSLNPAVATSPVAVGTNDSRVQSFTRSGTEVSLQNPDDLTKLGSTSLDQNTSSANYLQAAAGSGTAVSPANQGRIRYNEVSNKWQLSENGGAWVDITSGAVSVNDTYERTASFTVSVGAGTQEATLGRAIYVGSLVGVSVHMEDARSAGTATFNVKLNGSTLLTAVIDAGNTEWNTDTASSGTHVVAVGDEVTVEVVTDASYDNAASGPTGAVVAVALERS